MHNLCQVEHFAAQEIHMIIFYRGGRGRNSKIVKNILICKASDFDFFNKTKNEYRCNTILQSKTCFVIAGQLFLSVLI
jgi:hypothetical protein